MLALAAFLGESLRSRSDSLDLSLDLLEGFSVYICMLQFNEAHIPGSPFPILIGKMGADPALVMASGEGLSKGACGKYT